MDKEEVTTLETALEILSRFYFPSSSPDDIDLKITISTIQKLIELWK